MTIFCIVFMAFALLLRPASALEGVQVTKLYALGGCYSEYGESIKFIKLGEKIKCYNYDKLSFAYVHLIDETQFRILPDPSIREYKIEVFSSDEKSELTEENIKIRIYNGLRVVYPSGKIFLGLSVYDEIKVTDQRAIAAAESAASTASALSEADIAGIESKTEKAFGLGTSMRWDAYVNPGRTVRCDTWAYFEKNDEPTSFIIYKNPDSTKVKKILGSFYYAAGRASENKYGTRVSPLLVYTIGMGEGLVELLNVYYCDYNFDAYLEPISGFSRLGLDHFSDEIVALKSGGFLRNDFDEGDEYGLQVNLNEKYKNVNSAYFKNLHYGLEALAARVAYSKYQFERDIKLLGIDKSSFSEDEINYWTYYYFNTGAGSAKNFLTSRISTGTLHEKSTISAKPGEKVRNGLCGRHNAIIRTATAKFIHDLGIFA